VALGVDVHRAVIFALAAFCRPLPRVATRIHPDNQSMCPSIQTSWTSLRLSRPSRFTGTTPFSEVWRGIISRREPAASIQTMWFRTSSCGFCAGGRRCIFRTTGRWLAICIAPSSTVRATPGGWRRGGLPSIPTRCVRLDVRPLKDWSLTSGGSEPGTPCGSCVPAIAGSWLAASSSRSVSAIWPRAPAIPVPTPRVRRRHGRWGGCGGIWPSDPA